MLNLRDYQVNIANKAFELLSKNKFVYLAMEVRCGKTLTALEACKLYGADRVLFITKLKAFSSIKGDYDNFGYNFELTIINKESIHKIKSNDFDIIICDEAHGLFGTYPKANNFTKIYKKRFNKIPCILLSGTMSPESFSQVFHQFWINDFAPFSKYASFYKWAVDYVEVKVKHLGYSKVNDYSCAKKDLFWNIISEYILTFTQAEAGFTTTVEETILEVEMKPITYAIIERLKRDQFVKNPEGDLILGDTGVKMMQKCHQLYSGTVKFEDGSRKVIDDSKAVFINDKFKDDKIAIFYKFTAEYDCIKATMGDKITNDLEEFNNTDKWIALQIVSGREGISLKAAKYLVYYNIDFSAVSYWQSRDRLTTMERQHNQVFWIFAKNGIEKKIYQTVMQKKDYTLKIFKQNARTS